MNTMIRRLVSGLTVVGALALVPAVAQAREERPVPGHVESRGGGHGPVVHGGEHGGDRGFRGDRDHGFRGDRGERGGRGDHGRMGHDGRGDCRR